jgi:quercetin dioxygenase-like cupin family protein
MRNVFEDVPYKSEGMGNRKLVDEKHLLVMQIALEPGQAVRPHQANSNVHLLVLEGELAITLGEQQLSARRGDLVPVAFRTQMSIRNASSANATFLVIKTPNPSEMRQ